MIFTNTQPAAGLRHGGKFTMSPRPVSEEMRKVTIGITLDRPTLLLLYKMQPRFALSRSDGVRIAVQSFCAAHGIDVNTRIRKQQDGAPRPIKRTARRTDDVDFPG